MTDDQSEAEDPQPIQQGLEDGRPPLTRSEDRRVLAGVCGGLGRHLDIDPVIFRVVVAVLCLSGGLGLFLYGLAWLIVPTEEPDGKHGRTELQRVLTGRVDGQSIGAVLLTVIGTGVFFSWMGSGDSVFPLLLLGAMIFFAVRYDPERRRRAAGQVPPPPRPGGPYDRPTRQDGEPAPSALADWKTWRADFHTEWTARRSEFQERVSLAKEDLAQAASHWQGERQPGGRSTTETPPQDTPPPSPSGYLWDPRHPERNPYESRAETRAESRYESPYASQPWWQRPDLPTGDPLRKSATPAAPPPPAEVCRRRSRSFLAPLGLLVSAGAAAAVWSGSARHSTSVLLSTTLATALLGLGLTLLLGAKFGRARVLAIPALLITLLLSALGTAGASINSAAGHRSWAPASASAVLPSYSLGLGDLSLDLSAVNPAGGTVTTSAKLGAGDVHVTLPPDVDVMLTVRSAAGDVTLPDRTLGGGLGTDRTVQLAPAQGQQSKGTIDLDIEVGLGDVQVVQG
ncbi:phage shock protein PspC (stress-responsive transcriptional regulator) [Kitasatospora sp. MAP12-15]|uniref:PspC domain-containing protein n=1 Tax=unclassified Kitasatospora TaxID=2633591 RepID=UPI002474ACCB|nr:PspC domain-containing protein [Kitasatospora sp. MAP12-44]MDH6110934.1 phage shock protein PspC (stress-responsive transcriptional regulator) [Kitasatospora sp. MAP12-44]